MAKEMTSESEISNENSNESQMDLINRWDAVNAIRAMQTYKLFAGDDMRLVDQAEAMTELMMLSSEQPDIIRCKDCKHRGSYWGNCRLLEEKYHQSVLVDDDGFCSLAERRTDEQTN